MKTPNWPARLADFIQAARERPFCWGEFDCCLFAADCVLVQTGNDPAAEFRGRYSSALGAGRLLEKAGGLAAVMDARFDRIPVSTAGRGDVVMFEGMNGLTLGVYYHGVWAPDEQGVGSVNDKVLMAWRVE